MRHYPWPEYQFQKSTCVVEQRFQRAGTLKMANKQHYIRQDASWWYAYFNDKCNAMELLKWSELFSLLNLCSVYFIWLRGASRINRSMSSWCQLWMISTGCAKTSVWVCSAKQCRKVLLVMESVAWSAWHRRLTIPAWTKGGPLSAGLARPAKSRYQLWWWHTQCHWNNYPEGDCAARSLQSGSTLRFQVFHICL